MIYSSTEAELLNTLCNIDVNRSHFACCGKSSKLLSDISHQLRSIVHDHAILDILLSSIVEGKDCLILFQRLIDVCEVEVRS